MLFFKHPNKSRYLVVPLITKLVLTIPRTVLSIGREPSTNPIKMSAAFFPTKVPL